MISKNIKEFIESYFKLNQIDFSIDQNKIYNVKFTEKHANKLGKERKFSFNRTISDDYGVEYMNKNNDLFKYIIRDSINNGELIKAKIDTTGFSKEKLKLDKNIFVMKKKEVKKIGIAFLFKISSTNSISDSNPDSLRYIVLDYDTCTLFPYEITEEFHNFVFSNANFQFNAENVNKCHTLAYETICTDIKITAQEHELANQEYFKERISELGKRHDKFKQDKRLEEKKIKERIEDKKYRISASRSYDAEKKYRDELKKLEKKLNELIEDNRVSINQDFLRTEKLINEEKSKYNFQIKLDIISAIVFEYENQELNLRSNVSNDECKIVFNEMTSRIQEYTCPTCNNTSNEIRLSLKGFFCCENCSSEYKNNQYLCKKDDVVKCFISGNYLLKVEDNKCYSCENYFEKDYLREDVLGKKTCNLCEVKCFSGGIINKKDAKYSKEYKSYFSPNEVVLCDFSKEYFPKEDIETTTGSNRKVAKKYITKCKVTGLTFTINEVNDKKVAKILDKLESFEKDQIKYPILKNVLKKNQIELYEDNNIVVVKEKGLLRSKYSSYIKKTKQLV